MMNVFFFIGAVSTSLDQLRQNYLCFGQPVVYYRPSLGRQISLPKEGLLSYCALLPPWSMNIGHDEVLAARANIWGFVDLVRPRLISPTHRVDRV